MSNDHPKINASYIMLMLDISLSLLVKPVEQRFWLIFRNIKAATSDTLHQLSYAVS